MLLKKIYVTHILAETTKLFKSWLYLLTNFKRLTCMYSLLEKEVIAQVMGKFQKSGQYVIPQEIYELASANISWMIVQQQWFVAKLQ